MPETATDTDLFHQMQLAMLNPDELVWWLADIEGLHPLVSIEARCFWEKAEEGQRISLDDFQGWSPNPGYEDGVGVRGMVVSVGLDFQSQRGFKFRTYYLILVVGEFRKLQKVYLNDIRCIRKKR